MARKEKLDPAAVARALAAVKGRAYLAAEKLGISAQTVYNYARRHALVRDVLSHQKGRRLDTAEDVLWKAVQAGEAWAVCFFLKTQGKERGYVERTEHTGAEGRPLLDTEAQRKALRNPHARNLLAALDAALAAADGDSGGPGPPAVGGTLANGAPPGDGQPPAAERGGG